MKLSNFLFGALVGVAAGMLLAPDSGRRSRSLIRDKAVKYSHDAGGFVDKKSRHIANKAKGYAHNLSEAVSGLRSRGQEITEQEQEQTSSV